MSLLKDSQISPVPPKEDQEATWAYIKAGVENIMAQPDSLDNLTCWRLVTAVHNFCTLWEIPKGQHISFSSVSLIRHNTNFKNLYQRLVQYLKEYLENWRQRWKDLDHVNFLDFYVSEWNRYSKAAKSNGAIFRYLTRHYAQVEMDVGTEDVYDVPTLHFVLWKKYILLEERLMYTVLIFINPKADNEMLEHLYGISGVSVRGIIGYVVQSFESLHVHEEYFEKPFLEATTQYYTGESERLLNRKSDEEFGLLKYVKWVLAQLNEEKSRLTGTLRDETVQLVIKQCDNVLVAKQNRVFESYEDKEDTTQSSPLSLAARHGHKLMVRLLLKNQSVSPDLEDSRGRTPLSWAAENGHDEVVKLLLKNQSISSDVPDSGGRTPLSWASENGHDEIVKLLLKASVDPSSEDEVKRTPLFYAAQRNHAVVVQILLGANADPMLDGQSIMVPEEKEYDRVRDMLTRARVVGGRLSVSHKVCDDDDNAFEANLVDFVSDSGQVKARPRNPVPVKSLLEPTDERSKIKRKAGTKIGVDIEANVELKVKLKAKPKAAFTWYHLPANNMIWVELLMYKLYGYLGQPEILKQHRWVARQHHDANSIRDAHHARYMRPLCQTFSRADLSKNDDDQQAKPSNCDREIVLFMPYLHWEMTDQHVETTKSMQNDGKAGAHGKQNRLRKYLEKKCMHKLHVRRSLDQYYYHTLPDTEKRDKSQVPALFKERVITMVDQLWLWVLAGSDGQVDTVITCFPERQILDEDPDPEGITDMFKTILAHIEDNPYLIRTAYDLAGIIISKCSGSYLDPVATKQTLQFSKMYETAISDIVIEETKLFKDFRDAMRKDNGSSQRTTIDHLRTNDEIENPYTINDEIENLYKIKDIQDELNIMSVLYEDQKQVLMILDGIMRSMGSRHSTSTDMSSGVTEDSPDVSKKNSKVGISEKDGPEDDTAADCGGRSETLLGEPSLQTGEQQSRTIKQNYTLSEVWNRGHDLKMASLPIFAVQMSINQIEKMAQRAIRAHQALDFLVDIKQKQSSVKEAQYASYQAQKAREQAHQANLLTAAAQKQGKTLMVFTLVTIVFLPLSFMAAFFAIDIAEFPRSQGGLSLAYVSKYMFSISAAITVPLVLIAFNVDMFEKALSSMTPRYPWKTKRGQDLEAGNAAKKSASDNFKAGS